MRIGIITYYAVCNFGANLQVLSTIEYLRNNGHIPIVISWYPKQLEHRYLKITPPEQVKIHRQFSERYFEMTERCFTEIEVANVIEKNRIDAVIIGSDAVVQYIPKKSRIIFPCRKILVIEKPGDDRNCPSPFWGSFQQYLKNPVPMAMMSVSSQNSPYKTLSNKERDLLSKHLLKFDYISTRDDWTKKQLSYATRNKISPIVTPDPVFAFNYNVSYIPSKEEICKRFGLPEKYSLVSFHNSRTVSISWLKELKSEMLLRKTTCVAFPFPQGIEFKHPFEKEITTPLDPIDWYALIKYSAAYIGHNMHPIVVCLSNAVPCFSFDHYGKTILRCFVNEKSSKIYHIMSKFQLLQNRVNSAGLFISHPSVKYVIDRIDSFNTTFIRMTAQNVLNQYLNMMQSIIEVFERNKN